MTTEELKNAAGFKAVDAEGKELGIVALSDIVSAVKQELQPSGVARASVAALSEVSAQAATDTYEDQLPQKTDVTWIRGLDESGNPILISKQSLVSVAEELLPVVTTSNKGLMSANLYKYSVKYLPVSGTQMVKLYTKSNTTWRRKGGFVCLSNENSSWLYSFCIVEIADAPTKFQVSRIYGGYSEIEFYQKDSELYLYYNTSGANNISVIGFSSGNIESYSGKLDGTFTKVEVS